MTKNRTFGLGQRFSMLLIYFYLFKSIIKYLQQYCLKPYLKLNKPSFQLFSVPLIRSAIIITLQFEGTLNTPKFFYHIDKTKAQLLRPRLKQWNLLEEGVMVSFDRKRQSDIAMCCSVYGYLVYCNNIQ